MSRYTRDRIQAASQRTEAVTQLRTILFVDLEQSEPFTDAQVVALARLHLKQQTGLREALEHADWHELSRVAAVLGGLQDALRTIELADRDL